MVWFGVGVGLIERYPYRRYKKSSGEGLSSGRVTGGPGSTYQCSVIWRSLSSSSGPSGGLSSTAGFHLNGDMPSVLGRLASFPTVLPVSLQLSLLCVAFAMPSRCSPLKFFVPEASLLSLELPRLPRSLAVFHGVPQSSPEFPSLCRSSSLSAGVAATSLEPLSLGVLRRFFVKLPLSSESFPVVSYDTAIAS